MPHNIRGSPVICDPSNPHLISLKRGSIQFAAWRAPNRPSLLWQVSTLANNWSPVPCPVPQCDTEPKLFEVRWKEPHNRECGGEERRGRTRERLHSQTAISRDEAFLNKQKKKTINTVLVYQVESSLWLWSIYFLLHCFSRLLKCLWAVLAIQFSLEGVPRRPISSCGQFCLSCAFACSGQFIWCCNESWLVSITFDSGQWLGCPEGKQHSGLTELCLALWDCSPSSSLDRTVLPKRGEEMGREWVDMWTVAVLEWVCVLTWGPMFFKGHLFISDCWFLAMPQGETSVLSGGD